MSANLWEPLPVEDENQLALLFSGGFDSTTLLFRALEEGHSVTCIFVDYHQPQFYMERLKVIHILEELKKDGKRVHAAFLSMPLQQGEEGDYIPFRNLSLISLALNYLSVNYPHIKTLMYGAIGGCGEDSFYDCSPEFLSLVNIIAEKENGIRVIAPFIYMDKGEVAALANTLQLHPGDTWSCNFPDELGNACGKCKDCLAMQELYPTLYPVKK